MEELESYRSLGVALAIGLLVGLQREWKSLEERRGGERAAGERMAGLRTFGLIGLAGGLAGLIGGGSGVWLVGAGLVGVALLTAAAYFRHSGGEQGVGLTSEVAMVVTYLLGAAAATGHTKAAAAAAVVVALLLSLKLVLHGWVAKLERHELFAALKLLLISVVLLPVLPDRGYGPWGVLNPFEIWWMVVLIAGISFVGYFAMKVGGARHGAVLTGVFGGLASSTVTTLTLARFAKAGKVDTAPLAAGILGACATMFPRVLVVASAVNRALGTALAVPLVPMALVMYLAAFLFWRRAGKGGAADGGAEPDRALALQNPFQLGTALKFAALLVAVLLLGKALTAWLDEAGLYLLAAASGVADVDAITLSVARMAGAEVGVATGLVAVVIAATVNTLVKAAMALSVGGRALGWRVGVSALAALGAGYGAWLIWLAFAPHAPGAS
jgi:uncharacterized membrane protein (DUF4010 family)